MGFFDNFTSFTNQSSGSALGNANMDFRPNEEMQRVFDPGGFVWPGESSIEGQGAQQVPTLLPSQQALLSQLTGFIGGQIGRPGMVPPAQLGPVGPSGLQQQAFGLAGQLPQQGFDPNAINQAMAPVGAFARNQFQNELIPDIMSALGGVGAARSSGAADLLGRQARSLDLGIASQFAPMQFQAQQADLNRQFQLPGMLAGLGGLQRGIGTEQQQFNLERFLASDPSANRALGLLPQALGTSAFDTAMFQGFRNPSRSEIMSPGAGSAAGGAAGAIIASDARVKENIESIENALDKVEQLDGKTYNYIGKPTGDAGVIAQDLEKVLPDAVVEKDGVKYVKYEAVIGLLVSAVNELARKVG
jgi:hypothetical protein